MIGILKMFRIMMFESTSTITEKKQTPANMLVIEKTFFNMSDTAFNMILLLVGYFYNELLYQFINCRCSLASQTKNGQGGVYAAVRRIGVKTLSSRFFPTETSTINERSELIVELFFL